MLNFVKTQGMRTKFFVLTMWVKFSFHSMHKSKLVSLIKEVVRNEVKKQITDILISETNIPKTKPVVKKKKVKKPKLYTIEEILKVFKDE